MFSNPNFEEVAKSLSAAHVLRRLLSGARLGIIGFLCVVLQWPLWRVDELVGDRNASRASAETEIAAQSGSDNVVTGPILTLPYREWTETMEDKVKVRHSEIRHLHFLPKRLRIRGDLHAENRRRGLFEVPVFNGNLQLEGEFDSIVNPLAKVDPGDLLWQEAFVNVGLSSPQGMGAPATWSVGEETVELRPGFRPGSPEGVNALEAPVNLSPRQGLKFKVGLQLRGSGHLHFTPVGELTSVQLRSDWPHPSFSGSRLPETREVDSQGFAATWSDLGFGRKFPQFWQGDKWTGPALSESAFGVRFISPIDTYAEVARSTRYGLLFIVMTFLTLYLAETLAGLRIHPLQYLLVGCGLSLFYLLLLSLAEHLGFGAAYAIASFGIVSLIAGYAGSILRKAKPTITLTAMLAGLYGYLFVTLRAEDYALLLGASGLFVLLGLVMIATRRLAEPRPNRDSANDTLTARL